MFNINLLYQIVYFLISFRFRHLCSLYNLFSRPFSLCVLILFYSQLLLSYPIYITFTHPSFLIIINTENIYHKNAQISLSFDIFFTLCFTKQYLLQSTNINPFISITRLNFIYIDIISLSITILTKQRSFNCY